MLSAEEYEALIAASAERDALRGELRLVTAQRDLAEEKLRAYKHELFGASGEARHADQLGLFNEAEALATTTNAPARETRPARLSPPTREASADANHSIRTCRARSCGTNYPSLNDSARTTAMPSWRSASRRANSLT